MEKGLQDVWVLSTSGAVLFSRVTDKELNDEMLIALLNTLNMFTKEYLDDADLSGFDLSSRHFTVIRRGKILFAASSVKKLSAEVIVEQLKIVSERFYELYSDILVNEFLDPIHFIDFSKELELLEKPVVNFWNSMR